MKDTLAKIMGIPTVAEDTWNHATLSSKRGGLGIKDPAETWPACLLANLATTTSIATDLGADVTILQDMTLLATRLYCNAVGCAPTTLQLPTERVQAQLIDPIQVRRLNALLAGIAPTHALRLNSLT